MAQRANLFVTVYINTLYFVFYLEEHGHEFFVVNVSISIEVSLLDEFLRR